MRTEVDYAPPCRGPAHDDRAMDRDRFNHGTRDRNRPTAADGALLATAFTELAPSSSTHGPDWAGRDFVARPVE
jgi:hypothetical protein